MTKKPIELPDNWVWMSERERKNYMDNIEAIRASHDRIMSAPNPQEAARAWLVDLGTHNPDGTLTKEYGGEYTTPKEPRVTPRSVQRDPVMGYMCMTDYEHELGNATRGSKVYSSLEDLKENQSCVDECGIVEVTVHFRRVIQPSKH